MIQEAKLVGCLANFALAGVVDVTTAGTVSSTFCPLNADVDAGAVPLWVPMGVIKSAKDSTKPGSTVEVYAPTPGTLQLKQIIESKFKRVLTLSIDECSNLMFLALRRALAPSSPRLSPTAIGQFVGFTSGTVRGWVKFQAYNQDTQAQEIVDQFWCALQVDEVTMGTDKNLEFTAVATQLFSTLNTSTGA